MQSWTKGHFVRQCRLFYPIRSMMHSYHTVSRTDPCPSENDIVLPSVVFPLSHGWQLLNSLDHLISDPLSAVFSYIIPAVLPIHLYYLLYHLYLYLLCLHLYLYCLRILLYYYISCATNPRATLSTMSFGIITRLEVSIPRMFAEGLQYTKPNIRIYGVEIRWVPLEDCRALETKPE